MNRHNICELSRRAIVVAFFLLFTTVAMGQNKIDKMVDKHECLSHATFTSAVERSPKTRKVVKVVKVLEAMHSTHDFIKAFHSESKGSTLKTTETAGHVTMVFTEQKQKQNRIYMLEYEQSRNPINCRVTIIVTMKK